ncbi:MAG: LysM peptidoglycan-binding domain-containing protein [Pseudomonadales bacterium]
MKFNAITVSLMLTLAAVLVAGCKSTARLPPIEQMAQPPSIRLNYHIASRDDSLYTIAWRYGVDFRELAQRNRIAAPIACMRGKKLCWRIAMRLRVWRHPAPLPHRAVCK